MLKMSRLQLSSTSAKNVTISYVDPFLIKTFIVYVNSSLLSGQEPSGRVIKSFFCITPILSNIRSSSCIRYQFTTHHKFKSSTHCSTKARMLQSKSINKDVTNCYKVKITFFWKEDYNFYLYSKTNLAYKVATEIGTLFFKTSDFKNKRRYLLAQSV